VNSTVASDLAHDPSSVSFGGSGGGIFSSNGVGPVSGPGGFAEAEGPLIGDPMLSPLADSARSSAHGYSVPKPLITS